MDRFLLPLLCVGCLAPAGAAAGEEPCTPPSYLYQPSRALDDAPQGPVEPYVPQPGDVFLATDKTRWNRVGHWLAGGAGVHHSGILYRRPDGCMALLESGPFNSLRVESVDPFGHMSKHEQRGEKVWVRRRNVPLTPEQSARLTEFAEAQVEKPFATLRMVGQLTPFRTRGPVRTSFVGRPHGERRSYFCSELVLEACVAAGLLDPDTTRPSATYPRDLFLGRSRVPYLDKHLHLEPDWCLPARWTACP
jgi:hypothetical protein